MPEINYPPRGEFLVSIRRPDADVWQDMVEFRFAVKDRETGKLYIAQPMEFKERTEEEQCFQTAPALTIWQRQPDGQMGLQKMMDQLWALGLRPSDIGTPGHLAATTSHLADMRALVSKALDVKLP